MRVTLIAHAAPPAPMSGAQRAGNVARTLTEAGFHVHLVTSRRPGITVAERLVAHVTEVRDWPTGSDLLTGLLRARNRLVARVTHRDAVAGGAVELPPDPREPGPTFRRWVRATMRFPGGKFGFLPPALRAAFDPSRPPADVLYTTGPPITGHLIGLAARALGGPPWVAEYRDPWIVEGEPYRSPASRTEWTDAGERWLEERCLAAASEVVAVTEGIARALAPSRARLGAAPPRVVRNGIPDLAPVDRVRSGPRRIVHLGNLYAFRDPRPFFEGLAALVKERSWGQDDLVVDFVGNPPQPAYEERAEALGLGGIIRFRGWVDHDAGQALIRDADVLLLLAQRQPLQVPNKLYEYLGTRKPILAFADSEGESARLLRAAQAGVILTDDDPPQRTAAALDRLLEAPPSRRPEAESVLEALSTASQMARLPDIVRRAARGADAGRLP